MLVEKLDAVLNRMKRVLLGAIGVVVLAVLTILLLAPEIVTDLIVEIPALVRLLFVVVVYGGIGALGYSRSQKVQEGRQIKGLVVKSSGGVLAELSVEAAREQILKAVLKLPAVISADATVSTKRGKAAILLNLEMKNDDASLPDKQKEINRVLGNVVEKQLGLKLAGRPMVQISLDGGGLPASISQKGGTTLKSTEDESSLIEKLGSQIFGDQREPQSSELPAGKLAPDEEASDEPSGEFWEFLKSTASSSTVNDNVVDSALPSVDEVEEPVSDLLDVDASGMQDADRISLEEDDDTLLDSSS